MTVYIDEVFVVNLIMDWLILWATGNMTQNCARRWRLLGAAAVGAFYSIAIFLPWGEWLAALPVKIGCSFFMVWIAFGFLNWRNYLKCVIYLYLISFVLGGASIAAMYLFGEQFIQTWNGISLVQIDFQLFWLAVAAGMVMIAILFLRQHLRRDLSSTPMILTAKIALAGHEVSVHLLVDTGNSLTDPLSAQPVIVTEQACMLPLLPEDLCEVLRQNPAAGADLLLLAAEKTELSGRLRLIPYRAVGQQGLLLGFRPDSVVLQYGAEQRRHTNVIVALSEQKFSPYETYQGLVQPELF